MYGPWRQAEVLQEPRVQLSNGLDSTKGKPTSVPTTPEQSSEVFHPLQVGRQGRWGTIQKRAPYQIWVYKNLRRLPPQGKTRPETGNTPSVGDKIVAECRRQETLLLPHHQQKHDRGAGGEK